MHFTSIQQVSCIMFSFQILTESSERQNTIMPGQINGTDPIQNFLNYPHEILLLLGRTLDDSFDHPKYTIPIQAAQLCDSHTQHNTLCKENIFQREIAASFVLLYIIHQNYSVNSQGQVYSDGRPNLGFGNRVGVV